ncbi:MULTISPECIES: S8 family serine peptidase [unclassified Paenibacillus]|uniref:S8 family serine peptidase n=1 Tax=unclassified Paenibacillus TaxID=185978 RepID=UPI0036261806
MKIKFISTLLSGILLLSLTAPSVEAAANLVEDQLTEAPYIVKFKQAAPSNRSIQTLKKSAGKTGNPLSDQHSMVRLKQSELKQLQSDPNVEYIEPDGYIKKAADTIPPNLVQIHADTVVESTYRGKGVKIAIFDTGISLHSDELKVKEGISFVPSDSSYDDLNGHGTHAAGIIAATKNGKGIVGIAPDADLYAVKVLDNAGGGRYSSVIQALDWAIEQHMDIVSMSFVGEQYSQALEEAIQKAHDQGILLIAAAGNDGGATPRYPAKYTSVLSVGAVDENNQHAPFSNGGVEVVAPGVQVQSVGLGNQTAVLSGTSVATPHVAGIAALIKSQMPGMSNEKIRQIIDKTAVPLGSSDVFGHGLVHAASALAQLKTGVNAYPTTSLDEITNTYGIARERVLEQLEKGYTLVQIRQALQQRQGNQTLEQALLQVASGYRNLSVETGSSDVRQNEETVPIIADYAIQAAADTFDESAIQQVRMKTDQAPYSIGSSNESISTLTGSLTVAQEEFTLPGRNGLSFTLKRIYDSSDAGFFRKDVQKVLQCDCYVIFNGYEYTQTMKDGVITDGIISRRSFNLYHEYWEDGDARIVWLKANPGVAFNKSEWAGPSAQGAYTRTVQEVANKNELTVVPSYNNLALRSIYRNVAVDKPPQENNYHLGKGWTWNIPFISYELGPGYRYYHSSEGASYQIQGKSFKNYPWTDYQLEYDVQAVNPAITVRNKVSGITEKFDSDGRLVERIDPYDNKVTFTYTTHAKYGTILSYITDAIGNTIQIEYGDLSVTITQGDRTITYNKDTETTIDTVHYYPWNTRVNEKLRSVTDPLGRKTFYNYQTLNAGFSYTSGNNSYNPTALLTEVIHPTGSKTLYTYAQSEQAVGERSAQAILTIASREDQIVYGNGTSEFSNHKEFSFNMGPTAANLKKDYDFTNFICYGPMDYSCVNRTEYEYTRHYIDTTTTDFYNKAIVRWLGNDNVAESTNLTYNVAGRNPLPIQIDKKILRNFVPGETTTIKRAYNSFGQVISETDPQGQLTESTYDATNGWLLSVTQPISNTLKKYTSFTRNNKGKVTQVVVKENNNDGKLLQQVDIPLYDAFGNALQTIVKDDQRNIVTNNEYSNDYANAFLTKQSKSVVNVENQASVVSLQAAYKKATGQLDYYIDGNGQNSSYQYDALGRVTTITHPDGTTMTAQYDDVQNKITQTDETGATIFVKWNPIGQKIQEGIVDGTEKVKAKYGYDPFSRLIWTEDAEGNRTSYTYDNWNRPREVMYPDIGKSTTQYDDFNRTQTQIDAEGNIARMDYDKMGRVLQTAELRNNQTFVQGTLTYDFAGHPLTSKDAKGNTKTFNYDALGRVVSIMDPSQGTTKVAYSLAGLPIELTYPDANKITKTYDELGRLIKKVSPLQNPETFMYDGNSQVVNHTDPKGQTFTSVYSNRGFLNEIQAPDETIRYTYDNAGRRLTMTDSITAANPLGKTTSYTYWDNIKQLKTVEFPDHKKMEYTYDIRGNKYASTGPFGQVDYFFYDQRYRLEAVSASSNRNATNSMYGKYAYLKNNLVKQIVENRYSTDFTYEGLKLDTLTHKDMTTQTELGFYDYDYDSNQNITRVEGRKGNTLFDKKYGYDEQNRILTSSEYEETYAYNNRGNRTQYETTRELKNSPVNYEYDSFNRLRKAVIEGQTVTYTYNGDGILNERTENGQTTRYYNEGGQIVADATVSSSGPIMQARYIRGLGLLARQGADNGLAYYLNNAHGDVMQVMSSSGAKLNNYDYDLWGNPNPQSTMETVSNPFRYSGELWDNTTQLQYLRARWYDPDSGRFINKDTYEGDITNPLSLNLYTYGHNNPLRYTDPSGHCIAGEGADMCEEQKKAEANNAYSKPLREMSPSEIGGLVQGGGVAPEELYKVALYIFVGLIGPDKGGAKNTVRVSEEVVQAAKLAKAAVKSKDDLTTLYRAVSPNEYNDIMKSGIFRADPSGRGYDGKQFGMAFDEVLKLSDSPLLKDTAAIIKVQIPTEIFNKLDHTQVDRHILKSGSVTVQPEMLDLFNNSIIGSIDHIY